MTAPLKSGSYSFVGLDGDPHPNLRNFRIFQKNNQKSTYVKKDAYKNSMKNYVGENQLDIYAINGKMCMASQRDNNNFVKQHQPHPTINFSTEDSNTYCCQTMTNNMSSCTQDNQISYGFLYSSRVIVDISQGASERAAYIDTTIVTHRAKPVWAVWGPTGPTCKIRNCEQQKNQKWMKISLQAHENL